MSTGLHPMKACQAKPGSHPLTTSHAYGATTLSSYCSTDHFFDFLSSNCLFFSIWAILGHSSTQVLATNTLTSVIKGDEAYCKASEKGSFVDSVAC